MWSLGCVIAELFLGWPLYPGSFPEYDQVGPDSTVFLSQLSSFVWDGHPIHNLYGGAWRCDTVSQTSSSAPLFFFFFF